MYVKDVVYGNYLTENGLSVVLRPEQKRAVSLK